MTNTHAHATRSALGSQTVSTNISGLNVKGLSIEGLGLIINTTPHTINILGDNDTTLEIPATGITICVATEPNSRYTNSSTCPVYNPDVVGGITVSNGLTTLREMPPVENGVFWIVSGITASHLDGRGDILVPRTSPADNPIRNEKGWITAVRGLKLVR